jgi:hypothetical protein
MFCLQRKCKRFTRNPTVMQVVIRKHELDRQQEAKPELLGFSWQTQLVGDEYSLKPIEEYREIFFWLLETSGIPYRLKRRGSATPFS